jgi:uncharacterized cupin superfamily protein
MTADAHAPIPVVAAEVPPRPRPSNYPAPFAVVMADRIKRPLGDRFGLTSFGVNLTTLKPGGRSALRHAHTRQDEFVYIVSGSATLVTNAGEATMTAGMCVGFKAGTGDAHHLVNRSTADVVYLEVGDREPGDSASYPDDDIQAVAAGDGKWQFLHKDGTPY